MSSFYKMDPAAWDFGTSELSLEEEAAYLRIINAIHKHDAPVPNVDRVLAGLFRCSTRKARGLVDALMKAGKITIEDGKIWNDRARSDVVRRQFAHISSAERGAKGGRTRAENAAKALESNEPCQATASTRIEENRIEDTEAIASDADASSEPDFREEVLARGVRFLQARGVSERNARTVIGKWLRDHEAASVFSAFDAASRERPVEPVAWITARLGSPPKIADLSAIMATIDISGPHQ